MDTHSLSFDGWEESKVTLLPGDAAIACYAKANCFGRKKWVIIHATEINTMIEPFYGRMKIVQRSPATSQSLIIGLDCEYHIGSYTTLCCIQEAFVDETEDIGYCIVIPLIHLRANGKLPSDVDTLPLPVEKHIRSHAHVFCGNNVYNDLALILQRMPSDRIITPPCAIDFATLLRVAHKPSELKDSKLYSLMEVLLGYQGPKALKCEYQCQDWVMTDMDKNSILYAAMDAICSCELAHQYVRHMQYVAPHSTPSKAPEHVLSAAPQDCEVLLKRVKEFYEAKVGTGKPPPKGMDGKVQWIRNSYKGDFATTLKQASGAKLLKGVVALWESDSVKI